MEVAIAGNRADLWPAVDGISFEVADAAQPEGLGHALFSSESDLAAFGSHPLPNEAIPNDARNFIGRIGALLSPPGAAQAADLNSVLRRHRRGRLAARASASASASPSSAGLPPRNWRTPMMRPCSVTSCG